MRACATCELAGGALREPAPSASSESSAEKDEDPRAAAMPANFLCARACVRVASSSVHMALFRSNVPRLTVSVPMTTSVRFAYFVTWQGTPSTSTSRDEGFFLGGIVPSASHVRNRQGLHTDRRR